MDRRFRWELLEYRHTERSYALDSYVWADEPEPRDKLRKATGLEQTLKSCSSEWNQILTMMDWVHNLSAHQGWDEAPSLSALGLLDDVRQGKVTFRCVEFAHMLQHVYSAFGVPSRVVGLRRPNSTTGLGKGHVVVDAWSNEFGKWIVLDPQMNMFYTDQGGTPLSLFGLHDRVRQGDFGDIVMSRESEIESDFNTLEARDNSDYNSIEVPQGFDRDETWESLPEHSDFHGFTRFWQEYYYNFAVRRIYSFNRNKSTTGSSDGNELFYYDPHEQPPIVFHLNSVEVQWIPCDVTEETPIESTRKLTLNFKHAMPWFDHYDVRINDEQSTLNQHSLEVSLQVGENFISVTPVNDFGRHGKTSVVRMLVN